MVTVRCGCYKKFGEARKKLKSYTKKFPHSKVSVSYKYRFEKNKKNVLKKQKRVAEKKIDSKKKHKTRVLKRSYADELRLMCQAFLYVKDLEHARQTVEIALKSSPNSLYWNQKMAEILKWMGRGEEALRYLKFVYYKTKKASLAKEIIDYALASYHYENVEKLATQIFMDNPTKENRDRMLFIYNQIGDTKKSAQILKKMYEKSKNSELLSYIFQIYMDLGDLKNAQKVIELIEKNGLYSLKNIKLMSYFYYVKRDINKSYAVLLKYDFKKKYDKKINELLSDLGWYLQKYEPASLASLRLIRHKDDRLVDYERVIFVNQIKNPKLAMDMSLRAYDKFHLDYLFYGFANRALQRDETALLLRKIKEIDISNSPLRQEANYWFVKARLYRKLSEKSKTLYALKKAMELEPDNINIAFQAISFYQELSLSKKVKTLLDKLSLKENLPDEYTLAISSSYFAIHDVNRAKFYMDKLISKNSAISKTTEFMFLQDDIYKSEFNDNAHIKILREIRRILTRKLLAKPSLKNDRKFLYDSLRVSLYLDDIESFSSKLEAAKPMLGSVYYDNLDYSYALKIGAKQKAHAIYKRTKNRPIWLRFADALQEQNYTKIEDLLFYYLQGIPLDDASYGAHKDGQISLAQTLNFKSLNENSRNQNAYIAMLNYAKERDNLFEAKLSYEDLYPLLRQYTQIDNRYYIAEDVYAFGHIGYYKNSTEDETLINIPQTTSKIYLGIKKIYNKAEFSVSIGEMSGMKSFYTTSFLAKYSLNSRLSLQLKAEKNKMASESIELLLGGKKDVVGGFATYRILNSTVLSVDIQNSRYSSQDDVYLGKSTSIETALSRQFRMGYPDIRLKAFGKYVDYTQAKSDNGVMSLLRENYYDALPNDFYSFGLSFDYGMQNSRIYTRVWRPYFETSLFYSSDIDNLSYGFKAGYGGKVYTQDHLVFEVDYSNDANGLGGTLELFMKYQFLYTH
jgi:hypothetical protein